jgi:hypothetical protein
MESISLGWNCASAIHGIDSGIRKRKEDGYRTCPFDEMVTNYQGIIECINDDFEDLYNIEYLSVEKISKDSRFLNTNGDGDLIIYNKKYRFLFNHESPGHANLYDIQKWRNGINHYIMNNFEEFINRYKRRVENIKYYLNSNSFINFIITRPSTGINDLSLLGNIIKKKYPDLKYDFVILDCDKYVYYDHLLLMKIDNDDNEVKRLNITP